MLPCSCLLRRLNISEDIITSNCQTWIKCRQQVVPDLCRTFQRCHTPLCVHTHTHTDLRNPYFALQLSLFTRRRPSNAFILWQNVWTEPPPAITLSALVENVAAAQQRPDSRSVWLKWKVILFCRSHWQPESKQKFVWSCPQQKTIWIPWRQSGGEGFRRGERPRVASAWKFMNLQQSLVHLSHKSTLNLLLIISILYFFKVLGNTI